MPEHDVFDTTARAGTDQFATTVTAPSPASVRARGDRRRRRNGAVAAVTAAAVVGAAAGVAVALSGRPAPDPVVVTTPSPPRPVPTRVAPTAATTASAQPPTASTSGAPTVGLGAVKVAASGPTRYAAGQPNPFSLTVTNHGAARNVTVHLDLGSPLYPHVGAPALEHAAVSRLDPATHQWTTIPVISSGTDPETEAVSYPLSLPADTTVSEHLLLTPIGDDETVHVQVLDGSTVIADTSTTGQVVMPTVTATGPSTVVRGGAPAEFDFALVNPTSVGYPALAMQVLASCRAPQMPCVGGQGFTVQWYDGATWQPVTAGSDGWSDVPTRSLPPGGRVVIRLRITTDTTVPAGTYVDLGLLMGETAPGQGMPQSTPPYSSRSDAYFQTN